MTDSHLPFPGLVEERLILRRERRFLLLQGPYTLGVGETDGLRFRRIHGEAVAQNRGTVKFGVHALACSGWPALMAQLAARCSPSPGTLNRGHHTL